jgi:hypothetical protein
MPTKKPSRKDSWKAIGLELAKQACQIFYHDGKGALGCAWTKGRTGGTCPVCRARALRAAEKKRGKP